MANHATQKILRAQASIEALGVLLAMLLLLQILSLPLQTFHLNYGSVYSVSSQQQTLAYNALILGVRVCDAGVILPPSFRFSPQISDGNIISLPNSSVKMPILGPPFEQKILS